MSAASTESKKVARALNELSEAVEKDEELSEIATRMTGLGLHTIWLGQEQDNKKMAEVGEHFYKLGGDLQAICNARINPTIS
jgi:hypothetical protein